MVLLLDTALRVQSAIALVADVANDLGNELEDGYEGDDDVWVDAEEEEDAVEDWEDALDKESVIENADRLKTWTKTDGICFPTSFGSRLRRGQSNNPWVFTINMQCHVILRQIISVKGYVNKSLWNSPLVNHEDKINLHRPNVILWRA